jgi:hypothetical protein
VLQEHDGELKAPGMVCRLPSLRNAGKCGDEPPHSKFFLRWGNTARKLRTCRCAAMARPAIFIEGNEKREPWRYGSIQAK